MSQIRLQASSFEVPRLYGLADLDTLGAAKLPAVVAAMARGGLRWIQLRLKRASGALASNLVRASLEAVQASGVALWIDDRADLAALFPVLGVHLGQGDLPPRVAREFFERVREAPSESTRQQPLIGYSTHSRAQVRAADADPAVDVVAVGPVFATTSKEAPDPVVGLEFVRQAREITDKPLVAIGGIDAARIRSVLAAGADSAAVLGALVRGRRGGRDLDPSEIEANVRRLCAAVETTR